MCVFVCLAAEELVGTNHEMCERLGVCVCLRVCVCVCGAIVA